MNMSKVLRRKEKRGREGKRKERRKGNKRKEGKMRIQIPEVNQMLNTVASWSSGV